MTKEECEIETNIEMRKQIENQRIQLVQAKKLLEKLLEEEKNNMYWEMNGSDKSSYYEVRKQAEQFLREDENITQLYKKNGSVFIPSGITVEEVDELKKENTELKTLGKCKHKYMCSDNGKAVPCYTYYSCLYCSYKTE